MLLRNTQLNFLIVILFFCFGSVAQKGYRFEYGVLTGVSNYLGEIGGRDKAARPFLADLKLAKTRWDAGVYMRYKFHRIFTTKFAFNYLRIEGDDKLTINPARKYRNLSFRNDIYDLEGTINWHFYNSDRPSAIYRRTNVYFSAYLFTGIGGFYHNPKTLYQGTYIALQPLMTENKKYSKFGYCVPLGAGFYVTINQRRRAHRIGLEVNWRYTNTDYLDDISTVYVNPAELSSATSAALSNRNPEVAKQPEGTSIHYGWHGVDEKGNPINLAPRGDPKDKDSFMSVSVSYGMALKSRYNRSRGRKVRAVSF
jgi:hypothetical protein